MRVRRTSARFAALGLICGLSVGAAFAQDVAEKPATPENSPVSNVAAPTTTAVPESRVPTGESPAASEPKPGSAQAEDRTPVTIKPADPVAALVQKAIEETSQRRLTVGVHTPWQVVHGILALRWDFNLQKSDGRSDISAIEWIMSGPTFDGLPMWEITPWGGRGHPFTRPYAFEGHPTQFMGYMTMANIPLDYEVRAESGKIITIRDIINDAKMQVREGPEITWTLWALSHYEEPDAQWINAYGEPWSIERLVRLQIEEPPTSGACGGTHGLFALSYARNMYISTGKPLRGVWLEADQKIKRYIYEARALQNADGSFSANHFNGPGYSEDFGKRIATSGHQLEWLMVAMPQSQLKEAWFQNAIVRVANDLIEHRQDAADCGPLFHGLHALIIYRQRTVPGYLVPRRNSPLKLVERGQMREANDTAAAGAPADNPSAASAHSPRIRPVVEPGMKITRSVKPRSSVAGSATSLLPPRRKASANDAAMRTSDEDVPLDVLIQEESAAATGVKTDQGSPVPGDPAHHDTPVSRRTTPAAEGAPSRAPAGRQPAAFRSRYPLR